MARPDAGHHIGQQFSLIEKYTAAAKRACSIPVIAKMTPNITDMVPAALAAQEGGADGISAINTLKTVSHLQVDFTAIKSANSLIQNLDDYLYHPQPDVLGKSSSSGFSGRAGRPIGLRFVSDLSREKKLTIPISGMGGIYTWKDGLEYILLGASNLQVTTSVMQHGAGIVEEMIDGLQRHIMRARELEMKGNKGKVIGSIQDLVGLSSSSRQYLVDPSELDVTTEVVSYIDESKCIGCGACSTACRHGSVEAIQLITSSASTSSTSESPSRKAVVDPLKCIGCKLCDFVCPVDAITFTTRKRIEREPSR
jgi:dihydropyrimidine dehydrogenase (NAD+) subunit PreA